MRRNYLAWLGLRAYRRDINDYMTRWVLQLPWCALRAHRIRRRDLEDYPHDHPWSFFSLVLRGGYLEERHTPEGIEHRWVRWWNAVHATDVHRIVAVLPGTLTLVISGPKVRSWGFHTEHGFVPWRRYLGLEGAGQVP